MTVGRYVVVLPAELAIIGGPYLWDPDVEWTPPEIASNPEAGFQVMEEATALDAGYQYPEG